MTMVHRRFLPDRLRPRTPHRRRRRHFILPMIVVVILLLLLPLWTVRSVEIHGAEVVPESVTASFEGLVGHLIPALELEWLHQVAAVWPAASEVRVHLELPGTVVVEVFPESARGSAAVGSGWHAVAADGRLTGRLDVARAPELVGFRRPSDRQLAFSVARRLADGSGGTVMTVEHVTPADYRVGLRFGQSGHTMAVHVTPEGTTAEKAWCELIDNDPTPIVWADLRWPYRMVLREFS